MVTRIGQVPLTSSTRTAHSPPSLASARNPAVVLPRPSSPHKIRPVLARCSVITQRARSQPTRKYFVISATATFCFSTASQHSIDRQSWHSAHASYLEKKPFECTTPIGNN